MVTEFNTANKLECSSQPSDPSICLYCERILLFESDEATAPHQPDLLALEYSAQTCSLCRLINKYLLAAARREIGRSWLRKLKRSGLEPFKLTVSIRCSRIPCFRVGCAVGPRAFHTPDICVGSLWNLGHLARRPIWYSPDGTSFEPRVSTIVEWLTDCVTSHPLCRGSMTDLPLLPTRVLDLGLPGRFCDPVLREPTGERGLYIALSHCWGIKPPLSTTKATLKERCKKIEFLSLPRTFQDAVRIARSLTIRYLWIDSLCIIQDDETDWELESSRMAAVYEGAHLTISASAAAHSDAGCWRDFKPSHCFEFRGLTYFARLACDEHFEAIGLDGRRNTAPLAQRGWAFQESLLSRRVLHFGRNQLGWKCIARHSSEDGTKDSFDTQLKLPVSFAGSAIPVGLRTFLAMKDDRDRYNAWYRLIEHYSARKFTFEKDRLIALAGIVSIFRAISNDISLAGLWRNHLHYSLLWEVSSLDKATHSNQCYGIPSWSWAYVRDPVQFPGLCEISMNRIETMEASVTYAGQELTSPIVSTRLVLQAFTGAVTVGRRDLSRSNSCFLHPVLEFEAFDGPALGYCHFDFDPYPPSSRLNFMVVSADDAGNANVLVMRLVELAVDPKYVRVGVGKLHGYPGLTSPAISLSYSVTQQMVSLV